MLGAVFVPTGKVAGPEARQDGTVFPLKVAAPVVQWNGAQNGDQYKLHLKEEYDDSTIYFTTNNPTRHLTDAAEWIGLSESGQGAKSDPIGMSISNNCVDGYCQQILPG